MAGEVQGGRDEKKRAIASDGSAWCWGDNSIGQIGSAAAGSTESAPVQVDGISDVVSISAGWVHTCAVTSDGKAWCWGENDGGQIGDGTNDTRTTPVEVSLTGSASTISAGARHSCAVLDDGTVRCWGFNEDGQLGDGNAPNDSLSPTPVQGLNDVASVSVDAWHGCAATGAGKVWCWGLNWDGELGPGTTEDFSDVPVEVPGLSGISFVTVGDAHSCAASTSKVWCWGWNEWGQLGAGDTDPKQQPTEVVHSFGTITSLGSGVNHTGVADGNAVLWGANGEDFSGFTINGKAGLGAGEEYTDTPSPVTLPGSVAAVALGYEHTCALLATGEIHCWGQGAAGQLGHGTSPDTQFDPVEVDLPSGI